VELHTGHLAEQGPLKGNGKKKGGGALPRKKNEPIRTRKEKVRRTGEEGIGGEGGFGCQIEKNKN